MVIERQGILGLITNRRKAMESGTLIWPDGSVTRKGTQKTTRKGTKRGGWLGVIHIRDDDRIEITTGVDSYTYAYITTTMQREDINRFVEQYLEARKGLYYDFPVLQSIRWRKTPQKV